MSRRIKVLVAAGVLVLLVSGFFATMTFAADTPGEAADTPQALVQQFFDKLASKLGISSNEVKEAFTSTEKEMIDEQVQQGKLTQEQADQMKQRIDEGDGFFPLGGMHRGGGFGRMGCPGANLTDLSTFFGITTEQLQTELQAGKTLAQVAEEHGKTADQLKTYLHDQMKAQLDQSVKDGKITQQQDDDYLSQFDQKIDSMINGQFNWGRGGHWRGSLGNGQEPNPDASPTPTTSDGGASL